MEISKVVQIKTRANNSKDREKTKHEWKGNQEEQKEDDGDDDNNERWIFSSWHFSEDSVWIVI